MKRLVPLVITLCSVLLLGSTVQAAGPSGGAQHLFLQQSAHPLKAYLAQVFTHRIKLGRVESPKIRSSRPAAQTGSAMALDPSVFKPATVNAQYTGVEAASDADQNYFRGNHSSSYTALGMQGGYYMRADWAAPGGTVIFRYQGALFSNPSAAAAALQDAVNYVQAQTQSQFQDCSNTGFTCKEIVYGYQSGDEEGYNILQANNCLIETAARGTPAVIKAQAAQVVQTQVNINNAALSLPACGGTGSPGGTTPSTPTGPPSITIDQVGLVHTVNGNPTQTTSLKSKETGTFIAIYHVSNAGANTPAATLTILNGSKVLGTTDMQGATASDGTTGFLASAKFTNNKKKAMHLKAEFQLTLGSATASQTLKFTVKAGKK